MSYGFESRMNLSALKWETSTMRQKRYRREKRKGEAFIKRGCRWARQAYKLAPNEREIVFNKFDLDDLFVSLQQKFAMDHEFRSVKISHDIQDLADQAFGDFSHTDNLQYLYPTTIPTAFKAILSRNEKIQQNSSTVYKLLVQLIERARKTKEMCLMQTKDGRRAVKQHPGLRLISALIPEPQKDVKPAKGEKETEDTGGLTDCTCRFQNWAPQPPRRCNVCKLNSQERCEYCCCENWQCDCNDISQSRWLPSVSDITDSTVHFRGGKVQRKGSSDYTNPSTGSMVLSQAEQAISEAYGKFFREAQFDQKMTSAPFSEYHTGKIGDCGISEWAETKAFPRKLSMSKYPQWQKLGKSAPSPLTSWEAEHSEMGRGGSPDMLATNKKKCPEKVITEEEMFNFLLDNLENKVRQEMNELQQGRRTCAPKWAKSKKGRPISAAKTKRHPTSTTSSGSTSAEETGGDLLALLLNAFCDAVSLTLEKVQSMSGKSCDDVCDLLQAALRLASDEEFFTSILESLALVSCRKPARGEYKKKMTQRSLERRLRKKPRIFDVHSLMDILSQYSGKDTKSFTCSSGSAQHVSTDQNVHFDDSSPGCQSCSAESGYYMPSKGLKYEHKCLPMQLPIIDDLQEISDGSNMFKCKLEYKQRRGTESSNTGSSFSETTESQRNTNSSKVVSSSFSGITTSPLCEKKCKCHICSSDNLDISLSKAMDCQRQNHYAISTGKCSSPK